MLHSARASKVVSKELIDWADMIFVMEEHHREALIKIDQNAEDCCVGR